MVVKRPEDASSGKRQAQTQGASLGVGRSKVPSLERKAAPTLKVREGAHTFAAAAENQQADVGPHRVNDVLESRDLEQALLAGQLPLPSGTRGPHTASSAPQKTAVGPSVQKLAPSAPATRRITGVLSVADLERSFSGTAVGHAGHTLTAPTERAVPAPESAATRSAWIAHSLPSSRADLPPSLPGASAMASRATAQTEHQQSAIYESAFPSWSTTERGISVSATPSVKGHIGHSNVMKPHEIERVRYLQQRSLQLADSEDSHRAESFYARALAQRNKAKYSGPNTAHLHAHAAPAKSSDSGERPDLPTSSQQTTHANPAAARASRRQTPNAAALASALGAPPRWTPRAPRQVLTLAHASNSDAMTDTDSSEQASTESLQEDPHIKARIRIEQAFDLMHELALDLGVDQIDAELVASLAVEKKDPLRDLLTKLLGLCETLVPALDASVLKNSTCTQIFYSICAIPKGKRLLCQVWPILNSDDHQKALSLFLSRLAAFCNAELETVSSRQAAEPFWGMMVATIAQISSLNGLGTLVDTFRAGHARSRFLAQAALTSEQGLHLLRALFAQAFKLQQQQQLKSNIRGDCDLWIQASSAFAEWMTRYLGDAFDLASPRAAMELWELVALVDALVEPAHQARLRATLRSLIEQGRAPQPSPNPDSAGDWHTASSTQ